MEEGEDKKGTIGSIAPNSISKVKIREDSLTCSKGNSSGRILPRERKVKIVHKIFGKILSF